MSEIWGHRIDNLSNNSIDNDTVREFYLFKNDYAQQLLKAIDEELVDLEVQKSFFEAMFEFFELHEGSNEQFIDPNSEDDEKLLSEKLIQAFLDIKNSVKNLSTTVILKKFETIAEQIKVKNDDLFDLYDQGIPWRIDDGNIFVRLSNLKKARKKLARIITDPELEKNLDLLKDTVWILIIISLFAVSYKLSSDDQLLNGIRDNVSSKIAELVEIIK